MNYRVSLKTDTKMLPLQIMLITACLKWLIEGIFDQPLIEAVFLLAGIVLIVIYRGLRINKLALPWILYCVNIVLSLLLKGATIGLWGRAAITILITMFVLLIDAPVERYGSVVKLIIWLGIMSAGMVFLHALLGNTFNKLYFPLLNPTARGTAELYTRHGYFFGFLYNPHEPAGLIAYTIVALVIMKQLRLKKNIIPYLVAGILAVALLLTGKKSILVIMVLAMALIMLILYGSRKQVLRGVAFLFGIIVLAVAFIILALRHPEIGIFARFNEFLQQIFVDQSVDDSGRFSLYMHAISEWQDNKLFGIGWRHFNGLTTTKFNYYQSHEVNCDYLQWLCETGIVGFILSMIPVTITAYRAMFVARRLIRRVNNPKEQFVLLFAVFIQIFTLIYAFMEIPFFDIVFFSIYILSCVVINSAYRRRSYYYEQRR